MSARALARELEQAGLRPEQTGLVTWRAVCPCCWTPDESDRKPLAIWEWSEGREEIACWNQTCPSNEDIAEEPPYPGVTGTMNAPIWTAIVARIGADGLRRAWGVRRAQEITAVAVDAPKLQAPRIQAPR